MGNSDLAQRGVDRKVRHFRLSHPSQLVLTATLERQHLSTMLTERYEKGALNHVFSMYQSYSIRIPVFSTLSTFVVLHVRFRDTPRTAPTIPCLFI
jgi:hypothetical protein